MTPQIDIVVTTIHPPVWLSDYLENIRANGHADAVTVRIICDRKTPEDVYGAAEDARRGGFAVECPTLDEQETYLAKLGVPSDFIPWNSDNRRNIGYLQAWESGAQVLISIDDDNYCRPGADFVGAHCVVGNPVADAGPVRLAAGSDWFDICSLMVVDGGDRVYARGFPYAARSEPRLEPGPLPAEVASTTLSVNAGLWLNDPDVDAMTRLALAPTVRDATGEAIVLGPETWSPINTQNTALMHGAIPAYYFVRMGFALRGMNVDRFGDIFSGYFVEKCAKHLGHSIRMGSPVADHRRTKHNLFKDLQEELAAIVLLEDLLPWLMELELSGSDYATAYASLADALAAEAGRFRGYMWDDGGREFLLDTAECMRTWLRAIAVLA